MRTVNIHAAKTQLSRPVEAAATGEEIIIAKSGKPMVPWAARRPPTKAQCRHSRRKLRVPEDFDDPLPDEVIEAFEGR